MGDDPMNITYTGADLSRANGIPASGMPNGWKLNDNGYWEKA